MMGRVLVVAGSDSGGGAGIQADIKAVMAMGGFATTAITAITVQDTLGVHEVMAVPPALVRRQMAVVLSDIGADAIKTGMLGGAEMVDAVAEELAEAVGSGVALVVDPVMSAKGGAALLDQGGLDALRERLLTLATVITPNLPEAEALLGGRIADPAEAAQALRALVWSDRGMHAPGGEHRRAPAVLLKGGHGDGDRVVDVLAHEGGVVRFEAERIATRHTHGTGCTLASALAACLAQGMGLEAAAGRAIRYVQRAIRAAPGLGAGHGPLNHAVPPDQAEAG